jgi:hypothetical protein
MSVELVDVTVKLPVDSTLVYLKKKDGTWVIDHTNTLSDDKSDKNVTVKLPVNSESEVMYRANTEAAWNVTGKHDVNHLPPLSTDQYSDQVGGKRRRRSKKRRQVGSKKRRQVGSKKRRKGRSKKMMN